MFESLEGGGRRGLSARHSFELNLFRIQMTAKLKYNLSRYLAGNQEQGGNENSAEENSQKTATFHHDTEKIFRKEIGTCHIKHPILINSV